MSSYQGADYIPFNRRGYSSINSSNTDDSISIHSQSSATNHSLRNPHRPPRSRFFLLGAAAVSLLTTLFLLTSSVPKHATVDSFAAFSKKPPPLVNFVAPGISEQAFKDGLAKCNAIEQRRNYTQHDGERAGNPRSVQGTAPLLIKGGVVWTGNGYLEGYDILLEGGLITKIDQNIDVPQDASVIEANGRVVTPGIIDMHSHMGVKSWPFTLGLADGNEKTNPLTPQAGFFLPYIYKSIRVIDAFNPSDPAIRIVSSGGITTSLVLPGSANLMGGEALAVKLRPVPTLSVEEMQVAAGVTNEEKKWRYMKMACGENPKGVYGSQFSAPTSRKFSPFTHVIPPQFPHTQTPFQTPPIHSVLHFQSSGMGAGYLFRQRFQSAQRLLYAQDDWCSAASQIAQQSRSTYRLSERFPEELENESLVSLLRGDVKLHVHCYEPHDIEAIVRYSLEFGFEISALHHALQAWKIPDIIKRASNTITVATFSDMWGYKVEAYSANVNAPKILSDAGIPVAFKSDHPILNGQDLIWEAAKAYHYGLPEHLALSAVTSIPARAIGLDHRIGRLAPGYDADVVIWEKHPLTLGARPAHVIIDGVELDFEDDQLAEQALKIIGKEKENKTTPSHAEPDAFKLKKPEREMTVSFSGKGTAGPVDMQNACSSETETFVIRNIGKLFLSESKVFEAPNEPTKWEIVVIVRDGKVRCAGTDCGEKGEWPEGPVFDLQGGYVLPGLISTGSRIGLIEIESEPSAIDGYAINNPNDPSLDTKIVRAVDGLKFGGLHLDKAYKAGVLTSVTNPVTEWSEGFITGVSAAFRVGALNTVLDGDIIIKEEAALHVILGNMAVRDGLTISQQVAHLRRLLLTHVNSTATAAHRSTSVFGRAAHGHLPIVVYTENKDEIASVITIKRAVDDAGGSPRFVILGATESWLVADHLAAENIAVILRPARCTPRNWFSQRCLVGPPISPVTALDVLLEKGVLVGLASLDADDGYVRNLVWDAGWNLATNSNITETDAVGLVSWNIAKMLGLEGPGTLEQGDLAELVAYNGSPFELGTKVQLVAGGGRNGVTCFPQQI